MDIPEGFQPLDITVFVCTTCGALVHRHFTGVHRNWHVRS